MRHSTRICFGVCLAAMLSSCGGRPYSFAVMPEAGFAAPGPTSTPGPTPVPTPIGTPTPCDGQC